jgi:DNA-binding GntR family transcriptional regulator
VDILGPIKRHKTLTEQAADAIRARIVSGELRFGEALSEIAIASELGVSKTPVREAFLQLKNEGLVEIQPQRGTFVFQMSSEELRQLVELRELLELASLHASRRRGDGLGSRLVSIVDRMALAVADADHYGYRRLDGEFHQAIIDASGNGFIASAYHIIAFRIQALRNRLSLDVRHLQSLEEHRDIAHLVQRHNYEAAAEIMRRHIRGAYRDHLERIGGDLARAV